MNVFEAVKQSVTTRQAAEHYGILVGRNGMCVCPFHDDKNPSMKVDRRFHCFGCQADGDVIDFVSRLENVSPREAALMLAQDFSIPYEDKEPPSRSRPKRNPRKESPEQQFKRMERYCFRVLSDYHNLLRRWKRDYAPKTPEEEWHPLFVEAFQKQSHCDTLKGSGAEILWSVSKENDSKEKINLQTQRRVDIVMALDNASFVEAGEAAKDNDLYGAVLYGIGNSTEAVYYLDAGWAQCLVAPDEFDAGYESVAELIKKRRNFFYKMKDRQITYTVLTRENLFSEENRNLLFTISR